MALPGIDWEAFRGIPGVDRKLLRALRRRRNPPSPAYDEVRLILRQAWKVDPGDLEALATDVHAASELPTEFGRRSGLLLADGQGFLVEPDHHADCGTSGLFPKVLQVRPSADDARWNLRVLHELAHKLLDKHYPNHSHADVWALTLALAIPRASYCRRHEARHVPRWAVALRGETARAVARAA